MITNIIATAVIVLIIGLATAYIIREKKRGAACIGCSERYACSAKKGCSSGDRSSCNGCQHSNKDSET